MIGKISRGIIGAVRGTNNLVLRSTSEALKPKWLMFAVTNRCNSRCKHCDIWQQKHVSNELTPDEIEKTLKDPLFKDVSCIINSGGEATLRSDLHELLMAEHKALPCAKLQISTNGLLPERVIDTVKFALSQGIHLDVGISLDGIGEKHDAIRGVKGNFNKVDGLLHELARIKSEFRNEFGFAVGTVLSDFTLPSFQEVRDYLKQFKIVPLAQWYNEATFYSNLGESPAKNPAAMAAAVKSLPPSPVYDRWLKGLKNKPIKFSCFTMYTFCAMSPEGDLVPCLRYWDIRAGNVREATPTSIWHSQKMKEVRRTVKNCKGCLNDWGVNWSFNSSMFPVLSFHLRHPGTLMKKPAGNGTNVKG